MLLFIISFSIFISNIPFGYWRNNVKKFSLQWFLSIHIPVPFIILARIFTHLGFEWYTYFFTVSSFFIGQMMGKIIHKRFIEKKVQYVSSFILIDLYRNLRYQ